MPRVKRGTISLKRRKNVLREAKGYRFGRSKKERLAREAILHAGRSSFAHRRKKKGDFRTLWNIKISSQTKKGGLSYSKFIGSLKKNKIELNRKVLSELAKDNKDTFDRIVHEVKN